MKLALEVVLPTVTFLSDINRYSSNSKFHLDFNHNNIRNGFDRSIQRRVKQTMIKLRPIVYKYPLRTNICCDLRATKYDRSNSECFERQRLAIIAV